MLLPKKIGPFTLMRELEDDGIHVAYLAILDVPAGKQVIARKLHPYVTRDADRLAGIEKRVEALQALKHTSLAKILGTHTEGSDLYVLEEYLEGVSFDRVVPGKKHL